MTNDLVEFATDADVIFCIGTNTSECHPIIAMQMLRGMKRGAKLIVIDPKKTDMAKKADIFLQIPVGANIQLLNTIMNYIIQNDLYKKDFVEKYCHGFEYLKEAIKDFTLERLEKEIGADPEKVKEIAELYAKAPASSIAYTMGITQFVDGTANVMSLSNLALITGQIGRPGTGINPLRGQNNVQGACDMGALPNWIPAGNVTTEYAQSQAKKVWDIDLNPNPGYIMTDVPHHIEEGRIKLLYVFGENPAMSDPWTEHFIHAVRELETFIVQDIFLTETAQLADLVIPAATWTEKEGTFLNTSRVVQHLAKAIEPVAGLEPDWKVICNIANIMRLKGFDFAKAEEIWNEVRKLAPKMFGGISYDRIKKEQGLAWPCPDESHPGTPVQYADLKSFLSDGKFRIVPIGHANNEEEREAFESEIRKKCKIPEDYPVACGMPSAKPTKVYPCMFTTGRKVYHYHTGTMTRECKALEFGADIMGAAIEISPDIAESQGIKTGDYAIVENKNGKIAAKVFVNPDLIEGTIFTTFHYYEADGNKLADAEHKDPLSGMNPLKMSIAGIKKISEEEFRNFRIKEDELMHPSQMYKKVKEA